MTNMMASLELKKPNNRLVNQGRKQKMKTENESFHIKSTCKRSDFAS